MMYKKFKIVHGVKLDTLYNIKDLTGMDFKKVGVFFTITNFRCTNNKLKYRLDIEMENVTSNYIRFKNKYSEYKIDAVITCIFFEYGSEYYV